MRNELRIDGTGCEELSEHEAMAASGGGLWLLLPMVAVGYGIWKGIDAAIGGRAAINERSCSLDRQIREQQDMRVMKGMLEATGMSRP